MKKILIVDDEENARIGLSKILSRQGYLVNSVANGHEALTFLGRESANLVITDIDMPVMDGLVFLRELNRRHPGIDVIMITACVEVGTSLEAISLGAFEYLCKPIKLEQLKSVMLEIFQRRELV